MLYVLIPVAWLAVMALVVAVCRMAARGDRPRTNVEYAEVSRAQPTELGMLAVLDSDSEPSQEQEPVTVANIARRPLRRRGHPRRLPRRPVSRA